MAAGRAPALPATTYFDDSGIVISRGRQAAPFSVAIKAGHNAENHNHSDVGSYSLVLDRDYVGGDLGSPSYKTGAFDPDNPARSSWGHPVPRIANHLQSNGRAFCGRILQTDFSSARDRVVMDIKPAYEVRGLELLVRTLEHDKSGVGAVTIEDHFSASTPLTFGTAITTYAPYEIIDARTVLLTTEHHKVRVEFTGRGAALKITAEPIPVQMGSGRTPTRISLDFVAPIRDGLITVRYVPVLP